MKKLTKIVGWVGIIAIMIVALGFSYNSRKESLCWNFKVTVDQSNGFYFLDAQEVRTRILNLGDSIIGSKIEDIDMLRIKDVLNQNPVVKRVNVHSTLDGQFCIHVEQKTPIARIINTDGSGFYIDEEGTFMPTSLAYQARVLAFTGEKISSPDLTSNVHDIGDLDYDQSCLLNDIYTLSQYITNDDFLNAQIEHIYITNDEFELIPRVGNQIILMGDISQLNRKMQKLKAFYKDIIHNKDLNKYASIDLRYRDQVVCAKK